MATAAGKKEKISSGVAYRAWCRMEVRTIQQRRDMRRSG